VNKVDAETIALIKALGKGGGGGGGEKFIVTLTPTKLDFSGTMDKTPQEITAAYNAGKEIVFNVVGFPGFDHVYIPAAWCTLATTYTNYAACATLVEVSTGVQIIIVTSDLDDHKLYYTHIYTLASSGGGVLVVNVTTSGNTMTLDKTWQEIHDSSVPVFGIVRADVGDVGWAFCEDIFEDDGDFVVTFVFGNQSRDFTAASANGYPSYTE
jgi:hypothetical protein